MKYLEKSILVKTKMVFPITFIIIFTLIQCNRERISEKQDEGLKYAFSFYNIFDRMGWESEMEATGEIENAFFTGKTYFGGSYAYKKTFNDTIYDLYFEYCFNDSDTIFAPYWLYKRYIQDGFQHILSFDKGGDTLYHYKAELFGRMKKFFISGEYSYRYEFGEMNSGERMFFEQHKDSLKRIRGMNLPPLLIIPEQSSPPILERRYRGLCDDV